MAYSRTCYGRSNGAYNYSEFMCDTLTDLNYLPTSTQKGSSGINSFSPCSIGSKAIVMENKETYVLNNEDKWVSFTNYNCALANTISIATEEDIDSLF